MTALRFVLATLLALLPLPVGAQQYISLVQKASCIGLASGNETCAFTNAPANGDVVSIVVTGPTSTLPTSVQDSNAANLTDQVNAASSTAFAAEIWDYTVSASPTKTYSCNSATTACTNIGMFDIRLSSPSTYTSGNGTASTPTKTRAGAPPLQAFQICGYAGTNTQVFTFSFLLTTTSLYSATTSAITYGFANGLGANACTGSQSATNWVLVIGGYKTNTIWSAPPFNYAPVFVPGLF